MRIALCSTSSTTAARNEGKRVRTRSLLIDSAIALVAERGLLNTTVQELTRAAGLSNGTFYNHFDDREQLIREAATAIAIVLAEDIAERVQDVETGLGRIVVSTDMFISRAAANREWGKMLSEASKNAFDMQLDFANNLLADIQVAIDQGAPLQVPDRFRLFQIGALMVLAVEAQLVGRRNNRSTAIHVMQCSAFWGRRLTKPAMRWKPICLNLRRSQHGDSSRTISN